MNLKNALPIKRLLPEPVTPENYPELCETFYAQRRPNKVAMHAAHLIMASLYKPGVTFDQDAADMIMDNFAASRSMIIAANHNLYEDQYVIGSAMETKRPLKGFVGNTVILGKAPYFASPMGRLRNDYQAVIPVFRQQDIFAYVLEQHESMTEQHIFGLRDDERAEYADKYAAEISAYTMRTAKAMLHTTTSQLSNDINLFIFPEGTRNKDRKAWRRIQKLEGGIGAIACSAVRKDIEVTTVPMMVAYKGTHARHGSHVHIGQPIEPGTNRSDFMQRLEQNMQRGLDIAYQQLDKAA